MYSTNTNYYFYSDIIDNSDNKKKYKHCRQVLEELGLSHATEQDYINVRYICECVSRRAAHLVSAGAATLINKMGKNNVTVGIDGSVYRFHPHFHDLMTEKISQLVAPGIKVSSFKEKICESSSFYVF
jgi:hexokinase